MCEICEEYNAERGSELSKSADFRINFGMNNRCFFDLPNLPSGIIFGGSGYQSIHQNSNLGAMVSDVGNPKSAFGARCLPKSGFRRKEKRHQFNGLKFGRKKAEVAQVPGPRPSPGPSPNLAALAVVTSSVAFGSFRDINTLKSSGFNSIQQDDQQLINFKGYKNQLCYTIVT